MTDWAAAIEGRDREITANGPARGPATLGEIWNSEWKATGLDTTLGVGKPVFDAYDELVTRTRDLTGKEPEDLARERGIDFRQGMDGRIDALGRIIDTLPDSQQKLLTDYRDVRKRARDKAAEIERQNDDVAGASYGLAAHSTAFLAGVARQMVDPVNIATAPIGGPTKGPVLKWLGKEFLIGAGTQAAQEPFIAPRREALGLEADSFGNILEAGVGQAGFSALLRGAGAAIRAGRSAWRGPEIDVGPKDFEAAARHAEHDAVFDRLNGDPIKGPEAAQAATRAINTGEPITGNAAVRSTSLDLDGIQPIIRPDGSRLDARYAVVERRQLVTSHSPDGIVNPAFPKELQPRDRSQGTSQIQVTDIAGKLQPERLGPSPIAQEGAPIVGSDGIVESGNGRVLAIETAYSRFPDRAEAYRAYLETLGFEKIRDMKEPVLVRIRQQDLAPADRVAFASESNVATTGALSASERAFVDARGLHEGIMELWQGGQASDAKNAPFVRRFAAEMLAPQEQKGFVDQDGRLAAQGQDRIEAAVVARAYGDQAIVRQLTESTDQRSKSILGAFADSSPIVARLRAAVEDGRVSPDLDVSRALVDAFNMVERARRTGAKLGDMVDQIDLERGAVPDATRAAVQLFYRNEALTLPASREAVAERIAKAAEQAIMHQAGGFFGDELDAAAVLRSARFATENLSSMDLAKRMSDAAGLKSEIAPEFVVTDAVRARLEPAIPGEGMSWEAARTALEQQGSGEISGWLKHPDVKDPIDLPFGEWDPARPAKGWGYAKIAGKHPDVIDNLPEILSSLRIEETKDNWIRLGNDTHVAIVSLDFKGEQKTWLLTAYETRNTQKERLAERETIDRAPAVEKAASPPRQTGGSIAENAANAKPDPMEARINSAVEGIDPARQFEVEQPDGTMKKMTAAEQIEAIKAERKVADELNDCIDRTGGRIEDIQ